jgi:hypothetical protein
MALAVDKSSATFTVAKAEAKTAVEIGTDFGLLHCTRNVRVNLVNAPGSPDPTNGPAIRLTGKVLITGDPTSNADRLAISSWQVAVVQVSTVFVYELRYAGRTSNEGSMTANLRAGFNPNPCFDGKAMGLDAAFAGAANTVTPVKGAKPGFLFSSVHDDNPFTFARLRFENTLVAAPNFLHSVRRDEGFVSYLVVREPDGTTHFVAHIGWHIIWHGDVLWKSAAEKPQVVMRTSSFDTGDVRLGEPVPPDASLAMAKQPSGSTANELDRQAFKTGFVDRNVSILTASKTRPSDLPSVFF